MNSLILLVKQIKWKYMALPVSPILNMIVHNNLLPQNQDRLKFWIYASYMDNYLLMS